MRTTEYVVYRRVWNSVDQPLHRDTPMGIYGGAGRTAHTRMAAAIEVAHRDFACEANEILVAIPLARTAKKDSDAAWSEQYSRFILRRE